MSFCLDTGDYIFMTGACKMAHLIKMSCFNCHGSKIVHVVADGDMVCTTCGVVQQSHVIDDTYWGNVKYHEDGEITAPPPCYERFNPLRETIKTTCIHLLNIEHAFIIERTLHLTDLLGAHSNGVSLRGDRRKGAIATCFYLASREAMIGLSADVIYAYFQVPIWKEYSNVVEVLASEFRNDTVCCDSLRRLIYTCPLIDARLHWDLIKVAERIRQQVHHVVGTTGKPSKLNACYIYIARKVVEHGRFCIKSHCAHFEISTSTLHKHESIIQAALQANNKSSSI